MAPRKVAAQKLPPVSAFDRQPIIVVSSERTTTHEKKAAAPKVKAATAPRASKSNAAKGPGIIDTIAEVLKWSGGAISEIAQKVAKKLSAMWRRSLRRQNSDEPAEKPNEEGGCKMKIKREQVEGSNQLIYST